RLPMPVRARRVSPVFAMRGSIAGAGPTDCDSAPRHRRCLMPALSELHNGQKARIDRVDGGDAVSQRLMEMGLLEGDVIEVVGFAPLGDPLEIRLHDYCLSLRKTEAARVHVQILTADS